jgi:hypothetical protein
MAMKTQGEIEAAICDGISRIELEFKGRGPNDIRAHLIIARGRGCLATFGLAAPRQRHTFNVLSGMCPATRIAKIRRAAEDESQPPALTRRGVFVRGTMGGLLGWTTAKSLVPVPFTPRNERDVQRQVEELIRREEARAKKPQWRGWGGFQRRGDLASRQRIGLAFES